MLTTGPDQRIIGNDQVWCPVWKSGLERCSKNRKCTTIVKFWKGCLIEKIVEPHTKASVAMDSSNHVSGTQMYSHKSSSINVTNYDWSGNSIRQFVNIWPRWGYIEFLLFVEVREVKWRPLLSPQVVNYNRLYISISFLGDTFWAVTTSDQTLNFHHEMFLMQFPWDS